MTGFRTASYDRPRAFHLKRMAKPPPASTLRQAAEDSFTAPSPGVAAAAFFGVSLVIFFPFFLPENHIFGTDYLAGGYFFYHFISERLADGELPKWVPYVFGGMPLFANPGSTFYPIHLLADLVLPASKVFPAVLWFQFGIAGFGMYLLARELGSRNWIAFVAGVAFQFTGITMSWVYAGHDGRIIVATFAPLFFFFLHRGIRSGAVAPFVGAGGTIGFALLSFQIQNAYYLLLAAAIWAIFTLVHLDLHRSPRLLGRAVALGLGAVTFGFLMAAVNFLPFLDYVPESPRGQAEGRGYAYSTSYSMPEAEIVSLAVPEQAGVSVADPLTGQPLFPAYHGENGFKLHTEYVGALVLLLFAMGWVFCRGNRYWWFFLGLAVFFLTIALGGNTPLYRLYYEILPGTKRFRAPSLSFYVVAMSLVAMAAITLERMAVLRAARKPEGSRLELVGWIAAAVVIVAVGGALSAGGDAELGMPTAGRGWQRFVLFSATLGAILWFWTARKLGSLGAAVLLTLVTALDLWTIDRSFFHSVGPPEEMFAEDDVISFLRSRGGPSRVWMFPHPRAYAGPQGGGGAYGGDYPMLYEVEQVGGEHPNPLQRWHEYVGAGTETYIDWHNFITTARVVGDEQAQAIEFQSTPGFLEAANVRYIVSLAPLSHPALREVHRGSALVYENVRALPRAYLVPQIQSVTRERSLASMRATAWDPRRLAFVTGGATPALPSTPLEGGAEIAEYTPDRVVVRTAGNRAALLVLADNMYAGWRAKVDGRDTEIHTANHTFRGVLVPGGRHTVEFEFVPRRLYTGLYIYIVSLLVLGIYALYLLLASRRRRPLPAEV